MKKIFKILGTGFAIAMLGGVKVDNPAPDLFSTYFKTEPKELIAQIIVLLLGFAGLIAMAYIILGGYQIMSAGGQSETVAKGKKTLTNAIIGLVIIILSYTIISVVINAAYGKTGFSPIGSINF